MFPFANCVLHFLEKAFFSYMLMVCLFSEHTLPTLPGDWSCYMCHCVTVAMVANWSTSSCRDGFDCASGSFAA